MPFLVTSNFDDDSMQNQFLIKISQLASVIFKFESVDVGGTTDYLYTISSLYEPLAQVS